MCLGFIVPADPLDAALDAAVLRAAPGTVVIVEERVKLPGEFTPNIERWRAIFSQKADASGNPIRAKGIIGGYNRSCDSN